MTAAITPFLERANAAVVAASGPADGDRCVTGSVLARALWPDSPGWSRVSNVGYGATAGVGPPRAAGGVFKRLMDAKLVRPCGRWEHGGHRDCYAYRATAAGRALAADADTDGEDVL